MPTRLYRPIRERATALDHIMAHEWKFSLVAGLWTTLGAILCWTWIDPGGGPATIMTRLSPWAAGAVSIVLLTSGLLVLASILWRGDDRTAWRIELFALPLGASAWIAYAAVAPSVIWRAIAAWFVIGCTLRLIDAWVVLRRAATAQPPPPRVVAIVEE